MKEHELAELIRKRQENFIETRTKIETEVNTFLASIENVDTDIKEQVEYNSSMTAKNLLPELWNEPFNMDTYKAQLKELNEFIDRVHTICDKINQEAMRCLMQLQ